MDIGPANRDRLPRQSQNRQDSERRKASEDRQGQDRSTASETARLLQAEAFKKRQEIIQESARIEKLRAICRRVESGYYNRPEIKEKIAEKISDLPEDSEIRSASEENAEIKGKDISDVSDFDSKAPGGDDKGRIDGILGERK